MHILNFGWVYLSSCQAGHPIPNLAAACLAAGRFCMEPSLDMVNGASMSEQLPKIWFVTGCFQAEAFAAKDRSLCPFLVNGLKTAADVNTETNPTELIAFSSQTMRYVLAQSKPLC